MPTLGQILRSAGPAFVRGLGRRLLPSHWRAMRDIAACRTPALGGHLEQCDRCGHQHFSYHSCRNRHCPACGHDRAARWVERWRRLLPPCRYYLITVTVPEQLRCVARANQRVVYSLLLRESAHAVLRLAADPKWVGGQPAVLAVFHSWSRAMAFHPHVHLLVSSGGLSADGHAWVKPANPRFLMAGYVLQYRLRKRLEEAFKAAGLHSLVPSRVWHSRWVANVKQVGSGLNALRYLGRYLLRVAISNRSIESFDGERVTFRWTESGTARLRRSTLPAGQFIARFLQHVLPYGFVKVRAYGLLSPTCRTRLDAAHRLLEARRDALGRVAASPPEIELAHPAPRPLPVCPLCKLGRMVAIAVIPRQRPPPP